MPTTTPPALRTSPYFPICTACGTQYPLPVPASCRICLDPRQFVPPTGQTWTTLTVLQQSHHNVFTPDTINPRIWSIRTAPNFAIGQRAMLLQTPNGNILWDLITLLDADTVAKVNELGGLAAIVISHPHYYTTLHDWSATFPDAKLYIGGPDEDWLVDREANLHFLTRSHTAILPDVTAVLSGGHFPGSLCLHWDSQLFIADTILTVPSARNPIPGTPGSLSYTFWYSVPNRIPLPPSQIWGVWESVRGLEWHSTFGAFMGMDVRTTADEVGRGTGGVKGRLLESVRVFMREMGWVVGRMGEEWEAVEKMLKERTEGSEVAPGGGEVGEGMVMGFEL